MIKPLSLSLALGLSVVGYRLGAHDYFVAPDGTVVGPGTLAKPYDLGTALLGCEGQPGDTFWLRGGTYNLGHLETRNHGVRGKPITFRVVAGEYARVDGTININSPTGYLVLRDFELFSSDTNRVSSQTGVGFDVTDINILPGINCFAPNMSFINLVIHDQTRHGIYLSESSSNTLVYGCIVYNNGWVSPDNAEGHGIYVQTESPLTVLEDNLVFNNSGADMHIYQNVSGKRLAGITLQGNTAFNAGAIQKIRPYRDWIVGVDLPATYADGIILENNMGYSAVGEASLPAMQVGRESTNISVILLNNYMNVGLEMNNWYAAVVMGNLFASSSTNPLVNLNQSIHFVKTAWDRNIYYAVSSSNDFVLNSVPHNFVNWQGASGLDRPSTFHVGKITGTKVFFQPNLYQAGRENIIVYNWNDLDTVEVDARSVLRINSSFEVRNAQEFFGPPVLRGVYHGQALKLPMKNLSVAAPTGPANGPLIAAPPTGPTFNVFVVLSN